MMRFTPESYEILLKSIPFQDVLVLHCIVMLKGTLAY